MNISFPSRIRLNYSIVKDSRILQSLFSREKTPSEVREERWKKKILIFHLQLAKWIIKFIVTICVHLFSQLPSCEACLLQCATHASWARKFAGKKKYWKWWWWQDQWQSETQLVKTMLKLIYKNYKGLAKKNERGRATGRQTERKKKTHTQRQRVQNERIFCRLLLLRASHLIISCNHFNGTSFTALPLLSSSWSSPLHDGFFFPSSSYFSLRFGKMEIPCSRWRCRYIWLE